MLVLLKVVATFAAAMFAGAALYVNVVEHWVAVSGGPLRLF